MNSVCHTTPSPACRAPYEPAKDAAFKAKEREHLHMTATRLQSTASIPVRSVMVDGLIEDAILKRVQIRLPDLIVMASHRRGPLNRSLLRVVLPKHSYSMDRCRYAL